MPTLKRLRDPVHGLITFDLDDEIDKAAWRLIDTPEFQRLRRVKQLGVSEFTFPGATHTRLAHSIGVFHVARQLMKVAERYVPREKQKHHRKRTALIAALIHDLGHGPFSHAFENAEKARMIERGGIYKDHEDWTAEMIRKRGGDIRRVLTEEFGGDGAIADDIADLLIGKTQDLYSAVVSSSFDADRLDYLRRDRMMTGSGAGAIDFDWLLDNLRVVDVSPDPDDDAEENSSSVIQTFAFEEKALQAVEGFILARFHLYSQVYLHRTTRGIEQMLTMFLLEFAREAAKGSKAKLPVHKDHPLRVYYRDATPNLNQYVALDDAVVWSALEICVAYGDGTIRDFADRICSRRILKVVPIDTVNQQPADVARRKFIENDMKDEIGKTVFPDRAPLSIYKDPKRESVSPLKRVYIRREGGRIVDITSLSKPIAALFESQDILRFYFLNQKDFTRVQKITGEINAAT
ncbi:HD domain-containing protein [Labrys okinawensis]|uniref:HD domain-containing protein n=1 Tax=Labrys okinawensis TaxID=346911 RepID=UPI0039BD057D